MDDPVAQAYEMTDTRLASELRDLARRTRHPKDALRKAILLEAASRIQYPKGRDE